MKAFCLPIAGYTSGQRATLTKNDKHLQSQTHGRFTLDRCSTLRLPGLFALHGPNVGKITLPLFAAICCLGTAAAQPPAAPVAPAEDVFAAAVRTTEPLSPAEELTQLTVPDGFEITLFASEPQLQKPLNMAFDADGRLWVSGSNEYPYPAKDGAGRDSIRILKDTTGDGQADSVTVFADNLNIPMGLYPYKDGVIAFSIPNIVFLRDTNNDGTADKQEVLFGPFDTSKDTHGMNNAFRRGFDGWLYCCHGFNNQSSVSGSDDHKVNMHSGNTYRIRLDGSRIEHFTHGQVNPFGMAIDANGDIFNSDCHTKPVSLLLRGGYYESFGKPHDGLGYVPAIMEHLHGSTAIDALCQYQAKEFPKEFHDNIFVGNVMTSRIHRNTIRYTGSSVKMVEQPELLVSKDPWFRPVDIQVGPDGALYVADFYNRVIGHYEVPLDHPGRDRHRGRIWRIAYTKDKESKQPEQPTSLSTAPLTDLIDALSSSQKPIRQHAADQIVDRIGNQSVEEVSTALTTSLGSSEQINAPQLLWVLQRLNSLSTEQLEEAFNKGEQRTRIHAMRVCTELKGAAVPALLKLGLRDSSRLVQRAAADAASQTPDIVVLKEVINAMVVCPNSDTHLKHALKIALKNQLSNPDVATWMASSTPPKVASHAISEVISAVDGPIAGTISAGLLTSGHLNAAQSEAIMQHAADNVSEASVKKLFEYARNLPDDLLAEKANTCLAILNACRTRDMNPPASLNDWTAELASEILDNINFRKASWGQYSLDGREPVKWGFEPRRPLMKSKQTIPFFSSLPGGEKSVGILRSRPFVLPIQMEFKLCGHLGSPKNSPSAENRIVLRDLETGKEIQSSLPPRNDVATTYKWTAGRFAGRRAYIEVVDGMATGAYAWIAFSQFTPQVVALPQKNGMNLQAVEQAVQLLQLQQQLGTSLKAGHQDTLAQLVQSPQIDGKVRTIAAEVLLAHHNKTELTALADLLQIGTAPRLVDNAIANFCISPANTDLNALSTPKGNVNSVTAEEEDRSSELALLQNVFSLLNLNLRTRLSGNLADTRDGANLLLSSMERGLPAASILRDERLASQLSAYGENFAKRIDQLTKALPPEDESTKDLAAAILKKLRLGEGDSAAGMMVFQKHCLNCHKRRGEGGVAGPQLDGVATRGATRLLEDILHPNRNVDIAFRTSTLVLTSGKVLTGIVRPSEKPQQTLVMNTEGKIQTVPTATIDEKTDSTLSLMPGNVAKQLSESQIVDLLKYLLQ